MVSNGSDDEVDVFFLGTFGAFSATNCNKRLFRILGGRQCLKECARDGKGIPMRAFSKWKSEEADKRGQADWTEFPHDCAKTNHSIGSGGHRTAQLFFQSFTLGSSWEGGGMATASVKGWDLRDRWLRVIDHRRMWANLQ